MAYDPTFPADDEYLSEFPAGQREQIRAIVEDTIVNALKLCGLSPGNASGNIPKSNGTRCVNLNADMLDGHDATYFSADGHTHSAATTSSNGFMSNTDKTKLNGIATGAEVNQNAFANVKVGSTTLQADAKQDTLEMAAGSNIALTPDATNDKVTVAFSGTLPVTNGGTGQTDLANVTVGSANAVPWSGVTGKPGDATESASGLMPAEDKVKTNRITGNGFYVPNGYTNCNNFLKTGFALYPSSDPNKPTGNNARGDGCLFSIKWSDNWGVQIAEDWDGRLFTRGFENGSAWNAWKPILMKADIATGSSNGTISVRGTNVSVKGLGSAAYAESSSFAPSNYKPYSVKDSSNNNEITFIYGTDPNPQTDPPYLCCWNGYRVSYISSANYKNSNKGGVAAASVGANGYIKFDNGLIIQWGSYKGTTASVITTVTFPIAFPTACVSVQTNYPIAIGGGLDLAYSVASDITKTNFKLLTYTANSVHDWIAIGY